MAYNPLYCFSGVPLGVTLPSRLLLSIPSIPAFLFATLLSLLNLLSLLIGDFDL